MALEAAGDTQPDDGVLWNSPEAQFRPCPVCTHSPGAALCTVGIAVVPAHSSGLGCFPGNSTQQLAQERGWGQWVMGKGLLEPGTHLQPLLRPWAVLLKPPGHQECSPGSQVGALLDHPK